MSSLLRSAVGRAKSLIIDSEHLLEAAGDRLGESRDSLRLRMKHGQDRVIDAQRDLEDQRRHTARRVDRYAHQNPWRVAGAGLAIALLVGILIGASLDRRDR